MKSYNKKHMFHILAQKATKGLYELDSHIVHYVYEKIHDVVDFICAVFAI